MPFILRANGCDFSLETLNPQADNKPATSADHLIEDADALLRLYVNTQADTPLYKRLQQLRAHFIADLDSIETRAEIYGLTHWLLNDHGIRAEGASLEETVDRLSDIDIATDSDQYTDIIFHLRDAIDRLYEMELDDI
ncbi:hypothetical protein Q4488_13255 [Amphritea sp. 1_MG-2023]|uniref:hypothetical protein n=1 Tax=Amphritea sp. 1_MG-2023 TaxID=3062670 RepID=UPI0026E3AA6E|nr:hypothetical protein [Amphritea sp. 1_MG-2023]MDO6564357.1 hypothetical protein [Amphritea sp. 1_MG-2023]